MNNTLKFDIRLGIKDYISYNFYSLYKKPIIIFATILGICLWFVVLLYYLDAFNFGLNEFPNSQLLMAIFFTILFPVFVYFNAVYRYKSNPRYQKLLVHEFDTEWIKIKGESFESKLTWESIYIVKETKNWFLIFTSKYVANIIPLSQLNPDQIIKFRAMAKKVKKL